MKKKWILPGERPADLPLMKFRVAPKEFLSPRKIREFSRAEKNVFE